MRFISMLRDQGSPAVRRVLLSIARDLDGFVPDGGQRSPQSLTSAVRRWLQLGRLVAVYHQDRLDLIGPGEADESDDSSPEDLIKTWIEIRMIDDDGRPVPSVAYRIEIPGGGARTGTTNADGLAREENLDPGTCQVSFPGLHGLDWTRA